MFGADDIVEITVLPSRVRLEGVISFASQHHIVIACRRGFSAHLRPGAEVQLIQGFQDSLFQITTSIRCSEQDEIVVLRMPPCLIQRRSLRIECRLNAWYEHDLVVQYRKIPGREGKGPALISDISTGGAQVYVDQMLPVKTDFYLNIELNESTMVRVRAKVMRCRLLTREECGLIPGLYYVVGTQFLDVDRRHLVQLKRFVMEPRPQSASSEDEDA